MVLYMLDTDVASYMIKGTSPLLLERLRKHLGQICISAITAAELKYGATKKGSGPLTEKVNGFCSLVDVREWTPEAAEKYVHLRVNLEKKGEPIGSMDMLIAASAIAEEAILVTNNMDYFSRIPGLKIENWSK